MKTLGEIIRIRRKELKINQETLAKLAGISLGTLYKLERNESNPTLDIIKKVADVLGLELRLTIKGDES